MSVSPPRSPVDPRSPPRTAPDAAPKGAVEHVTTAAANGDANGAASGIANGSAVQVAPAPDVRPRRLTRAARNSKFWLRLAFLASDCVLIHLGFLVAYWLRYELRLWPEQSEFFDAPFSAYYLAEGVLLAVLLTVVTRRGLYRLRRSTGWLDEVGTILNGTTIGVSVLVMVFYIFRPGVTSRAMLVYAWLAVTALLSLFRLGVRTVVEERRKRGIGLQRVLVVGAGHMGKMIMQQLAGRPGLGYVLAGFCDDVSWAQRADFGRFQCLGPIDDLETVIAEHATDEVIIALPSAEHERVLRIVGLCEQCGVGFSLVPDTFDLTLGTLEVDHIAGIPLIGLREHSLHGFNRFIKRSIDVVVSAVATLAAVPVLALVALAVWIESGRPVFFPQERVGLNGRVFRVYKVRSMRVGAEQMLKDLETNNEAGGVIFKMKNDPRRTRVGRIIRKLSLDELPQLWNVLKGDMSLVGPRPPFPHEVALYEDWHKRRLEVVPGLTGLWQVSGRSDLPFEEMVMLDLYYIENWSLGLDLKIILRTIPAVITMRGAY